MLKLSSSFGSVRFTLLKIWTEWVINCYILCQFKFPTMITTIVGAGAVGAASRYGSGSDQMMRLLAAPALQHWLVQPKLLATIQLCSERRPEKRWFSRELRVMAIIYECKDDGIYIGTVIVFAALINLYLFAWANGPSWPKGTGNGGLLTRSIHLGETVKPPPPVYFPRSFASLPCGASIRPT
jgi:hypothetical protein